MSIKRDIKSLLRFCKKRLNEDVYEDTLEDFLARDSEERECVTIWWDELEYEEECAGFDDEWYDPDRIEVMSEYWGSTSARHLWVGMEQEAHYLRSLLEIHGTLYASFFQ